MDLKGKVIIITGAAGGIGAALAARFLAEKPEYLLLLDLQMSTLEQLYDSLSKKAINIECLNVAVCDVTNSSAIKSCVQTVEQRYGRIDLFCSNAGVFVSGGASAPQELWQRSLDINVMAHVHAADACLPLMLSRGEGYFLQTISAAGLLSQIGSAPYSVSKHAALAFAEWVAITHGGEGIKVTALCPQGVSTAMLNDIDNVNSVAVDGLLSAEKVAIVALEAIEKEQFLALPHPKVSAYAVHRAENHGRWIVGMQRLAQQLVESK